LTFSGNSTGCARRIKVAAVSARTVGEGCVTTEIIDFLAEDSRRRIAIVRNDYGGNDYGDSLLNAPN
jgi:hypothetical protein